MAQEIKGLVRLANTDIKGEKPVLYGLARIYGLGVNFSNAVCEVLKIDKRTKIGALDEKTIQEIEYVINNPASKNIPKWTYNRRGDYDSGEDMHLTGPKLKLTQEFDVRKMKKIKSYKGIRHMYGLPVRGQRTRGNFRGGVSVGVMKKAITTTPAKEEKGAKKKR